MNADRYSGKTELELRVELAKRDGQLRRACEALGQLTDALLDMAAKAMRAEMSVRQFTEKLDKETPDAADRT